MPFSLYDPYFFTIQNIMKRSLESCSSSEKRAHSTSDLETIDQRLSEVACQHPVCFDMSEALAQPKALLENLRNSLEHNGVAIVRNAITPEEHEAMLPDIGVSIASMFRWTLPSDDDTISDKLCKGDLSAVEPLLNCKELGLGNAGFSFLYKHTPPRYHSETLDSGERVELDINPVYHDVNLELLERNKRLVALIFAVQHGQGTRAMVSHDSIKFSSNPSPKPKTMTKQNLTAPHFDNYGAEEIDRLQGMVVVEERTKLGFVPGTTDPLVKSAIASQLDAPKLYTSDGFKRVDNDPKLLEIFHKHWIAAPKYSLVLWRSGVVHYEACVKPKSEKYVHRFESLKNMPNQLRIRYVVGTHRIPDSTSERTVERMSKLAARGLSHAVYSHSNKKLPHYRLNIVNFKATQFLQKRPYSDDEDAWIENAIQQSNFAKPSDFRKFLMGCRETPIDELFDGDSTCLRLWSS